MCQPAGGIDRVLVTLIGRCIGQYGFLSGPPKLDHFFLKVSHSIQGELFDVLL